jgi:hypothetical protein
VETHEQNAATGILSFSVIDPFVLYATFLHSGIVNSDSSGSICSASCLVPGGINCTPTGLVGTAGFSGKDYDPKEEHWRVTRW